MPFFPPEDEPQSVRKNSANRGKNEAQPKTHVTPARQRACSQQKWRRRKGKSDLLRKNDTRENDVAMPQQKFQRAVHASELFSRHWFALVSPVYFANSAVSPHWPLMTNSRIGLRMRGAFSLV